MPKAQYGKQWQAMRVRVFAMYGKSCWMCGEPATEVDHLDPVQHFGPRVPPIERLRPACKPCNVKRGHRTRRWGKQPPTQSRDW